MKFEIVKKKEPPVKDSSQEYFSAFIARSGLRQKVEAGRGIQFAEKDNEDDANDWVQATVESAWGMKVGAHYSDEAIKANGWLISRWHGAIKEGNTALATVLERLMLERQATVRLEAGVRPEDLKMELAIPPKELNPAYNTIPRREPSKLDSR